MPFANNQEPRTGNPKSTLQLFNSSTAFVALQLILASATRGQRNVSLYSRIEQIARRFKLTDIYVFGSRAREIASRSHGRRSRPREGSHLSDVDIGVRPCPGAHLRAEDRVDLMAAFEDLFDAPRVDLVVLPESDPYLALDVVCGELLYTADPDEESRYQLFVLRRAGDLLPFKKERVRMILEEGAR